MRYQLDFLYVDRHPLLLQSDHNYYSLVSSDMAVGVARHSQLCQKSAEITNFQYLNNDLSYCFGFLHAGLVP